MDTVRWLTALAVLATLVGVGGAVATVLGHLDAAVGLTLVVVAATVGVVIGAGRRGGGSRTAYW